MDSYASDNSTTLQEPMRNNTNLFVNPKYKTEEKETYEEDNSYM